MVFRKNITITVACVITEFLLCSIPSIFIIYIFFMWDKIDEIYYTLLIVPYLILIINVLLLFISLVFQVFIKTKFCLNKMSLIIKNKEIIKSINYNEVSYISYDFGCLEKYNISPSQLCLFDKDLKQLLVVNNPSILMVHMIKKRCKKAKVSYYHNKRFLYLLILTNCVVLLIAILAKIFL